MNISEMSYKAKSLEAARSFRDNCQNQLNRIIE